MTLTSRTFPHFALRGTHREVGRQHGEAVRDLIRGHLDLILRQASRKSGLTRDSSLRWAEAFAPYVERYSPGFMEEIRGVAEGASVEPAEAMLLQVRQEVTHLGRLGHVEIGPSNAAPADRAPSSHTLECTGVAVSGAWTASGGTFAAQNADLSGDIEDVGVVFTFAVTGKPAIVMMVPAGQISYIGMNALGMSANGNFLNSTGWRAGYPRYLLTRLALEQSSVKAAVEAILVPPRASSRNVLLADATGQIADVETTAEEHAVLWGDGRFVHANHYLAPELAHHEKSSPEYMRNTRARQARMEALTEEARGRLDAERLKACLADHANAPDSICAHKGERPPYFESYTFASVVASLDERRLDVAVGPPCRNAYVSYRLAA